MRLDEIVSLNNDNTTKIRTNAEILDETYYEYHGKYDDGFSPADEISFEGVIVA